LVITWLKTGLFWRGCHDLLNQTVEEFFQQQNHLFKCHVDFLFPLYCVQNLRFQIKSAKDSCVTFGVFNSYFKVLFLHGICDLALISSEWRSMDGMNNFFTLAFLAASLPIKSALTLWVWTMSGLIFLNSLIKLRYAR